MVDRIDPSTSIGAAALVVSDLDRSLAYYTQRIGLDVLGTEDGLTWLGVGGRRLLALLEQAGAKPAATNRTGLYHFALLTPSRRALGLFLRHLIETRTAIAGASDHGVSEAIYLADPDGHGIEVYRDRPRSEWPYEGGALKMVLDPLDAEGILAAAEDAAWSGIDRGTVMGHIHLHVASLSDAEAFYVDVLGFELMQRFAGQASFIAAGGYHHHLGVNIWAGRGAAPPAADAARLLWYEIRLPDRAGLGAVTARLQGAGAAIAVHPQGLLVHDPAQNAIVLTAGSM
jgi:catechol 2,3-dioxygenase